MTEENGANLEEHSSPLKFPCDFIIKSMGKSDEHFEKVVLDIIKKEFPKITAKDIKRRPSKDNNYTALTVTVHAESKEPLDRVYKDLSDAPEVLMAL